MKLHGCCHDIGVGMIELTRMNQAPIVLNVDLIEYIEVVPDTIITLTTGQKLMVKESAREITEKIIEFRRAIFGSMFEPPRLASAKDAVPGV